MAEVVTLILGHLEILHKNKLVCHALFAAKNKWHPGLHFGVRERAHQEHLLELVVVTNGRSRTVIYRLIQIRVCNY